MTVEEMIGHLSMLPLDLPIYVFSSVYDMGSADMLPVVEAPFMLQEKSSAPECVAICAGY